MCGILCSGLLVCEDCSRRKFLIPYVDACKESRVCNDCYFFLISGASVIFEETLLGSSSTPSSAASRLLPDSNFELDTFFKFKQDVQEDIQRNIIDDKNLEELREGNLYSSVRFECNDDNTLKRSKTEKNVKTLSSSSLFAGRGGGGGGTKTVTAEDKCSVCSTEFSLLFKKKQICKLW